MERLALEPPSVVLFSSAPIADLTPVYIHVSFPSCLKFKGTKRQRVALLRLDLDSQ